MINIISMLQQCQRYSHILTLRYSLLLLHKIYEYWQKMLCERELVVITDKNHPVVLIKIRQ